MTSFCKAFEVVVAKTMNTSRDFLQGLILRSSDNAYLMHLAQLTPSEWMSMQTLLFYGYARNRTIRKTVSSILTCVFSSDASDCSAGAHRMRPGSYGALKYMASNYHIEIDFYPYSVAQNSNSGASKDTDVGLAGLVGDPGGPPDEVDQANTTSINGTASASIVDIDAAAKCFVSDFIPNVLSKSRNMTHPSGRHMVVIHGFDALSKTHAMAMRKVLDNPNIMFVLTLLVRPWSLSTIDPAIRSRATIIRLARCRSDEDEDENVSSPSFALLTNTATDTLWEILKEERLPIVIPLIRDFAMNMLRFQIPLAVLFQHIVAEIRKREVNLPDAAAIGLIKEAAHAEHLACIAHPAYGRGGSFSSSASYIGGLSSASNRSAHLCIERFMIAAHQIWSKNCRQYST